MERSQNPEIVLRQGHPSCATAADTLGLANANLWTWDHSSLVYIKVVSRLSSF